MLKWVKWDSMNFLLQMHPYIGILDILLIAGLIFLYEELYEKKSISKQRATRKWAFRLSLIFVVVLIISAFIHFFIWLASEVL